jgi:hypothetical protein
MMANRTLGIVALCAGLVGVVAYAYVNRDYKDRIKLTIEVQTPEGIKSGSGVIETAVWESADWGPSEARGIRRRARGDAIFVDLGQGRNLVALLAYGPDADEGNLFGLKRGALGIDKAVDWKDQAKVKGRGELPTSSLPILITFSNLNDPATARRIEPEAIDGVFGPGFKFRRAIVETTNEPIGPSIETKLLWWTNPGRPADVAWRAWRAGDMAGVTVVPEYLFKRE